MIKSTAAAALAGSLLLTLSPAGPAQSAVVYTGCVSRPEFIETRQLMSQHTVQEHVYGTHKKPVTGKLLDRTEHRKVIKYRGCNPAKWDNPRVKVYYRNDLPGMEGKWAVRRARGWYIPKLVA